MSDYFDAPEYDAPAGARVRMLVLGAQVVLGIVGLSYLGLGVVMGLVYGGIGFADPDLPPAFGIGMGLGMFGCSGSLGLLALASAAGLQVRARWAWLATMGLGGMFLGSICLPFGAYLLYAMLVEDTRKEFLG